MTYTPHWSASQHAERILVENAKATAKATAPMRYCNPRTGMPFNSATILYAPLVPPDTRSVALALAWVSRDKPMHERIELLQMIGAIE